MVTVKVVYQSSGKPAEGRKVSLYVSKFFEIVSKVVEIDKK